MQKDLTIGTSDLTTPYIGMGTWAIGGGMVLCQRKSTN